MCVFSTLSFLGGMLVKARNSTHCMSILVVGATGATGHHLVEFLLDSGCQVRAVVRTREKLPQRVLSHPNLAIIQSAVLDLTDDEIKKHVAGCTAVASCLGHNISFRGLWGAPRMLCTNATARLCNAIAATNTPGTRVKFVLMSTVAVSDPTLNEKPSLMFRSLIRVLHWILPPAWDNEMAARYLRNQIGLNHPTIDWVAVRPDSLHNKNAVTPYEVVPSPYCRASCITSRINVADFMASLIRDAALFSKWKGKMPTVYDQK